MSEWSDLFNVMLYGEGALIGLAIFTLIAVIAIAKIRASGIVFVGVAAMMCISVISNAGNNLEILTGALYGLLIPFFMIAMLAKGKGGVF